MKSRKRCIIAGGGGLRGSYVVGVVKALIEEFGITSVDIAIGTSSGAPTLAYFIAGQFDSIVNIWTNLVTTWKFASFRNLLFGDPVLNVDYLVDNVFKQQDRLNIEAVNAGHADLFIPATEYNTGQSAYFSNRDGIDLYEVLRATMAIQIFYGRAVEVAGKLYVDGALSTPLGISRAVDAGATDIIIISTRPAGFQRSFSVLERLMTQLFTRAWPENLKRALEKYPETYNSCMDLVRQEIEKKQRNIVLIQPTESVTAGKLNNTRINLLRSIQQGYTDACRHTELHSFGTGTNL